MLPTTPTAEITRSTVSWLTPPSAFVDLPTAQVYDGAGTNPDLPSGPLYVPRASVPIPVDDGSGNRRQTWLQASLLTYLPRFDIDHESWFCDVNILPGSAPEPFMRLGLVRYQPYAPEALRGAEQTIRAFAPTLAICVYHKPEHLWEIPQMVREWRPDYRLYLRHYSTNMSETVMFALAR